MGGAAVGTHRAHRADHPRRAAPTLDAPAGTPSRTGRRRRSIPTPQRRRRCVRLVTIPCDRLLRVQVLALHRGEVDLAVRRAGVRLTTTSMSAPSASASRCSSGDTELGGDPRGARRASAHQLEPRSSGEAMELVVAPGDVAGADDGDAGTPMPAHTDVRSWTRCAGVLLSTVEFGHLERARRRGSGCPSQPPSP